MSQSRGSLFEHALCTPPPPDHSCELLNELHNEPILCKPAGGCMFNCGGKLPRTSLLVNRRLPHEALEAHHRIRMSAALPSTTYRALSPARRTFFLLCHTYHSFRSRPERCDRGLIDAGNVPRWRVPTWGLPRGDASRSWLHPSRWPPECMAWFQARRLHFRPSSK